MKIDIDKMFIESNILQISNYNDTLYMNLLGTKYTRQGNCFTYTLIDDSKPISVNITNSDRWLIDDEEEVKRLFINDFLDVRYVITNEGIGRKDSIDKMSFNYAEEYDSK